MKRLIHRIPKPGPGALITAAFIGPGTITTCTMAGANFGFALLWGLVFSIIATLVLQEMAARLGILTGQGLGEALKTHFSKGFLRVITLVLVISAIAIGNAAFETGNIMGATLGIASISGQYGQTSHWWVLLTGMAAFILLYTGSYKAIEKTMVALVILMSVTFITTALLVDPPLNPILNGMLIPALPPG
ncbi:MAG: Nramp family divalent metal transporter, partial [Bacteroidota bacterium]